MFRYFVCIDEIEKNKIDLKWNLSHPLPNIYKNMERLEVIVSYEETFPILCFCPVRILVPDLPYISDRSFSFNGVIKSGDHESTSFSLELYTGIREFESRARSEVFSITLKHTSSYFLRHSGTFFETLWLLPRTWLLLFLFLFPAKSQSVSLSCGFSPRRIFSTVRLKILRVTSFIIFC